ncbi:uncharacterized protein LOC110626061 isoform X3 [Manihot esculenta]|uniref:Uncharacterized protein n=1 Tax=Manihot esculenta TaxID=3983 RepID=A0ACB7GWE6_MANES|nr:uncharacterized protein LOC110626061 isoform X3 [Manihot esculenta]KAG8644545.1 hypothetical protein MANES_11G139900v8 [Manihot esculenta]
METDLSLIEISGEDDSLLSIQHISPDAAAATDNSYFSCSPLLPIPRSTCSLHPPSQLLASPVESRKGTDDTCIPSSSSCEDSRDNNMNKENVNLNKPEPPKLSLEPQQMKRKKKGGGYNLRKSLAWNRAFFTEEGVLDPSELSMLSGHSGKSSGEMLSIIHEGRESLCGELDSISDSPDLQSLEHNLFKELPSSTPTKNRNNAAKLTTHLGSPAKEKKGPASAAKRKVLSTHDINRSASKRNGCPRQVASSHPKANTTKVATKTSRVSKLLGPKPDPSVVSTTSRSSATNVSHSKRNYISQPVNAQKNIGLKDTSTNTKTVKNSAQSAPAGKSIIKSTAHQTRRNVVKVSGPVIDMSSKVQLPQGSQLNSSSEVVPVSVVPSVVCPAKGHDSNASKIAFSFSQIGCFNGGNMQSTQPQPAKPSGLRMPSPSLGFFGQSKSSGSHSLLQRSTQCNLPDSNIPNKSKVGAINSIHQKPPRPSRNIPSCSSTASSSSVNAALCGKIKPSKELNSIQKVTLQVQLNSESSTNCKRQPHDICGDADTQSLDLAEPYKILKISSVEHVAQQSNDNKLPFQNVPCEQLEQDDVRSVINACVGTRDTNGSGLEYPHSTSSHSLPMEVEGPEANNTAVNQSLDLAEPCKILKISSVEQMAQQSNDNKLPLQNVPCEQLEQDDVRSVINACVRTRDTNVSGLEYPHSTSSPSLPMEVEGPEANSTTVNQNVEDRQYNPTTKEHSFCSESQSAGGKNNWGGASSRVHEAKEQSPQQDELMKPDSCQTDFISNVESQRLNGVLFEHSRASEDINKHDSSKAADASLKVQECGATEYCQSHITYLESTKEGTTGINYLNRELHVGDAQILCVEGNMLVKSGKVSLSTLTVDNSNLIIDYPSAKSAEQAELLNPCLVTEPSSQYNSRPLSISCLLPGKGIEEDQEKDVLQSFESDESRTSACEGELGSSDVLFSTSPVNHDSGLDGAGKVACIHIENDLTASVNIEPVVENFRRDIELSGEANATAERMGKGDMIGAVITGGVKVNNFCSRITSQISSAILVEVSSRINDTNEHEFVLDKQLDSSTKNFTTITDLQPANEACYRESDSSILHNDCFNGMHDVKEESVDQFKLIASCAHEAEQGSQSREARDDNLSNDDNRSFGGISAVGGSVSEIPQSLHQCEIREAEHAGVDDMIKDRLIEDAVPQHLDNNLTVDSYNSNASTSLTVEKSSLMVDDISRQPKQCPELQNLDVMIEEVPSENNGLCSGDNLLLVNTVESQEEDTRENISGTVLEQCDSLPAASTSFDTDIQTNPVMHDAGFNMDNNSELPSMENIRWFADCKCRNELDNQAHPWNFDSSSKKNEDRKAVAGAVDTSDSNKTLDGSTRQDAEVNLVEGNNLPVEAEIAIYKGNGAVSSEVVKEATLSLKKSGNDKRQEALVIRPPQNAVPFSDEWLAAFEAAGEEILMMKGGAVQNSPQDKSLPEPGPWSPVKRKNNQGVGPFDCTKFTNSNIPSSNSN